MCGGSFFFLLFVPKGGDFSSFIFIFLPFFSFLRNVGRAFCDGPSPPGTDLHCAVAERRRRLPQLHIRPPPPSIMADAPPPPCNKMLKSGVSLSIFFASDCRYMDLPIWTSNAPLFTSLHPRLAIDATNGRLRTKKKRFNSLPPPFRMKKPAFFRAPALRPPPAKKIPW